MSAVFNFPSGILLWSAASSRNLFSQTGTCLAALHHFCFPLNFHKPVLMSLSQPPPYHICRCLCNLSFIIIFLAGCVLKLTTDSEKWNGLPCEQKKKWCLLVSWPSSCSCLVCFLCLFHDKHLHLLEFVSFLLLAVPRFVFFSLLLLSFLFSPPD